MTDRISVREAIAHWLAYTYGEGERFPRDWERAGQLTGVLGSLGLPLSTIDAIANGEAVVVPKEPTETMRAAGQWEITNGNVTVNWCVEANMNAREIYRAMLADAQEPTDDR